MRVIITAGGTGGHIYPALAILKKIIEKEPNSAILYIGTHNRMEKDIIPAEGFDYVPLEIYGFSKSEILRDIKNVGLIRKAYKKCLNIMKDFKRIPGKSNRALAKKVSMIGVSFEDSKKYFDERKTYLTGNPCGENALDISPISKANYGLHNDKKSILVVAGSLGSKVINDKMLPFLQSIDNENYEVLYVTGKNYYEEYNKNKFSKNVIVVPYINNLSALMKSIDLIVTRAGASTISEIMSLEVPSIFIPSPYVANNHQYYNALSMQNNKASLMIEEKDLTSDLLKEKIHYILDNPDVYNEMKKNLKEMSINNSSTMIYNLIKNLLR